MCRLAAYMGKNITLSQFLLDPEHSLVKQSWAPNEMQDGTVNADGFGVAWVSGDNQPCVYKNILPIWSDNNLKGLGPSITSTLWLANVRGATPNQAINQANTQPFIKDRLMFTHNGSLKPFDNRIKSRLLELMSVETRAEISGDADSLYLFALLRQQLLTEQTLSGAIANSIATLTTICGTGTSALLNFIVSDHNTIIACRHAVNGRCPSLYYSIRKESINIASEPLTAGDDWNPLPEHSLMRFNHSGIIEKIDL